MPDLVVRIVGDTTALTRSYKSAQRQTTGFARSVERAGRGATVATIGFRGLGRSVAFASGAFLGGAGLVSATKASVQAASDLNEQIGKTQVVFGQSGRSVVNWSTTTAQAFGESQRQALDAASSFGALLRPLGLVGSEAADQSRKLTQLGADLASFYNTDVSDALLAIRSGLVGEVEPLRRYGVLLSQARVQAEALTETHKRSASQLTSAELVQARLNLIMRDSVQAQGDFARSSDRLAGQTKILQAQIDDLQTEIGKKLIPGATGFVRFVNEVWLPGLHDASEGVKKFAGDVDDGAKSVKKSSGDFTVAGVDVGAAFVRGFDLVLGIHGKDKNSGGILGQHLQLVIRGALTEMQQGIRQIEAKLNAPTSSLAASGLGTDTTQFQTPGKPFTPEQRNTFFDARVARMLDRVQDIRTIRGQITQLRAILALVKERLAVTKDITRQNTLSDTVAGIDREILADQAALADKAAAAALVLKRKEEKAAKAEKAAIAASLKRATDRQYAINQAASKQIQSIAAFSNRTKQMLQTQQRNASKREQEKVFGLLGLTKTGDTRAPSKGNLLAQLDKARGAIAGTPAATAALEQRLTTLRRVINTEFSKLTRDTKIKVSEFLAALTGDTTGGRAHTKTVAASLNQLTAGTGLSGAGLRRLEANIAGAHLTTSPIHVNVNIDGNRVASSVTTHQKKQARRVPYQTRGRVQ